MDFLLKSSCVPISTEQISGRKHPAHLETSVAINDEGISFDVELFFQRETRMLKVSKTIFGLICGELKSAHILFQLINLLDQSGSKRKEIRTLWTMSDKSKRADNGHYCPRSLESRLFQRQIEKSFVGLSSKEVAKLVRKVLYQLVHHFDEFVSIYVLSRPHRH